MHSSTFLLLLRLSVLSMSSLAKRSSRERFLFSLPASRSHLHQPLRRPNLEITLARVVVVVLRDVDEDVVVVVVDVAVVAVLA